MNTARTLTLTLALSLAFSPAMALTLDDLAGRWRGEGVLSLNQEPEQRLRCQIRFRPVDAQRSFFTGRCATGQAARSFTYMLTALPGGAVRAENAMQQAEDEGLPMEMQGTLGDGILRIEEPGTALFELRLNGEALEFRLEGDGREGFARSQALLHRTEGAP
ncbi:hypothetical protein [Pararhodobacter sp.]|uniref:hypothetical protein n=1 Tax=Pararhodobacter sp. TaxID=2127056 RepID=UPI002FDDD90E